MNERMQIGPARANQQRSRSRAARWLWMIGGVVLVSLGVLGLILPRLPTTVFFIGAAACFSRSNKRFERWVLQLPRIGLLVRDYRAGLGMARRAKLLAITTIMLGSLGSVWIIPSWLGKLTVGAFALLAVWYILARVPTREQVLAKRAAERTAL